MRRVGTRILYQIDWRVPTQARFWLEWDVHRSGQSHFFRWDQPLLGSAGWNNAEKVEEPCDRLA